MMRATKEMLRLDLIIKWLKVIHEDGYLEKTESGTLIIHPTRFKEELIGRRK
jgi:hypothetical protein